MSRAAAPPRTGAAAALRLPLSISAYHGALAGIVVLAGILDLVALDQEGGGYRGWDRILDRSQLAQAVSDGTVRFFLVSGSGAGFRGVTTDVNADLAGWITTSCRLVPPSAYGSSATEGAFGPTPGQLYDCR